MMKQISNTWQKIMKNNYSAIRGRTIALRKENTIVRVDRPSRLDRAKALGYKSKQGVVVVRIKVSRGGMRRQRPKSGRRPKHLGVTKMKANVSTKQTAQRRVKERYPNLILLNSYFLYQDCKHIWHEVILIDPSHHSIQNDGDYKQLFNK